jgi:3-methyladenine DNA glycosylase AlkC
MGDCALPSTSRKGAPRVADVPPAVLAALEAGSLATVNLTEFLAVRPARLLAAVRRDLAIDADATGAAPDEAQLAALKPMQRHRAISLWLYAVLDQHPRRDQLATQLATHPSDVVRQWAALWLQAAVTASMSLPDRLRAVRPFAADAHFGVREIAWMAVRDAITADVPQAVALLQPWVRDADASVRRFASEATRPRGVWCAHIATLKTNPGLALPLLEPLRADASIYVRDSVANWLNDASKTQPRWVAALCERWQRESPCAPTHSLVKRALRTLQT